MPTQPQRHKHRSLPNPSLLKRHELPTSAMVFFTCNHCGSSLKKNKVDMHHQWACLKPISVSCHDCLKDFGEGDYQDHIKCITEDVKYSVKGFTSKPPSNKGERKQQGMVRIGAADSTDRRRTLPKRKVICWIQLLIHQNIPKKRPQFKNFICNIFHGKISQGTVDRVWNLLEERKNKMNPAENESESKQNAGKENEDMLSTKEPLKDGEVEESVGKSEKKGNYWLRNRYEAELKDIKNQQLGVLEELGDCKQQRKKKKKRANEALNEEGNVDGSAYGEESNVVKEKKLRKSEIQDSTTERQTVHISKRRGKKRQLNNDAEYGMEGNVGKKKAFQKYKVKNSGTEEEETVEVSKKRGRKSQLNDGDNAESAKERQEGHAVRGKKSLKDNVKDSVLEGETIDISKKKGKNRQLDGDNVSGGENTESAKYSEEESDVVNKRKTRKYRLKDSDSEREAVTVSKKKGKKRKLEKDNTSEGENSESAKYREESEVVENNVLQKSEVEDSATEREKVLEPKKKRRKGDGASASTSSKKTQDDSSSDSETEGARRFYWLLKGFCWQEAILKVLRKKGGELPLHKLRKKVFTEYESSGLYIEDYQHLNTKFIKKLCFTPGIVVLKHDIVKLRL